MIESDLNNASGKTTTVPLSNKSLITSKGPMVLSFAVALVLIPNANIPKVLVKKVEK